MLRLIYKKYKKRFLDFFMEDMLLDIPEKISQPAIAILAKDREVMTKFLYYQAHVLHRRDPSDLVNMERKAGMLIQIKLLLTLIGTAPRGEEPHPVVGKTVAPPEDWHEKVEKFKKGELIKKK